jgi:hypothetical protein
MPDSSYTEYRTPPEAPSPRAIKPIGMAAEVLGAREAYRLALAYRSLAKLPPGNNDPVILIPGWKAPQETMAPLRRFLRNRNYNAHYWGLGTNQGDPEADSERLAEKVAKQVQQSGRKVALVGWSLGGVIAREVGRNLPGSVAQVITYGTPVIGGPTFTPAARVYGEPECRRISNRIVELDEQRPIAVPITAIFTRKDRIVSWPACIDRSSPNITHYEVRSTHVSMGFDPDVWQLISKSLRRHSTG